MRALRRITVTLVVLAGLFVAADFGTRSLAQAQAATSLQAALELSKRPSVSLGGFPFLLHAIEGRLDEVVLSGANLSAGGQDLRRVRLTLRDVGFSASALVLGRETTVRFRSSRGTAEMTGADVTAALRRADIDADVRLRGGLAHVSVAGLPRVRVTVGLEGNDLVLRAADIPLPVDLRVDLSDLIPDIQCTDIHIEGAMAVLEFTVTRSRLDL
ncbi:MAG: DUF2993 domain-containing protein [Actinomycetota bacterium]